MLRFFSKIRYELAAQNRAAKYMRYAIGEIVLVTIGILIALQVNDWNEIRKMQLQANYYKEKLINDLAQDTLNLRNKIKSFATDTLLLSNYFDYVRKCKAPESELIDSIVKLNNTFNRYLPVNYTFKDMLSSGSIGLLSESTRKELIDLSNSQEFLLIVIEKTITDIKLVQHEALKNVDYVMAKNKVYENMPHSFDTESNLKILIQYNNVLMAWYEYFRNYMLHGEIIVAKSKTTLLLLKENK